MSRIRKPRFFAALVQGSAFALGSCLAATMTSGQVLPPPPVPADPSKTSAAARLRLKAFAFEGNTAFTKAELTKLVEPFVNRDVTADEIEQARRAITVHYVDNGYINSGAIIPDQNPTNGVVTIRIVEGQLSKIALTGNTWLWDGYIHGRLRRWSATPLNLNNLQEGLKLLRQNPNVRQVNAELKPGNAPGESQMDVKVETGQPFRLGLQIDNQRPPSVGSGQLSLLAADLSLTGHSDPLEVKYGLATSSVEGLESSGVNNVEGSYSLPVTRFDTTIRIHGSRLNSSLVEEPFPALDITSRTTGYGVALRQPLFQTANTEAAISVGFERRINETSLLGVPFNISPGAVNGEMSVSVLRVSQEWVRRGQDSILALRSTFNVGLDVLDATDNGVPGDPNNRFFSWVGQGQYIQRLFKTQNQLVLRMAGQWTQDPLPALEQISVGGMESVRGYLENQLVRDRGIVASAEVRVPLLFNKAGAGILEVAPFVDFGGAWNIHNSPNPTTIYSSGVGLLYSPNRHVSAQLYWGYRLRHVVSPDYRDPQGLGLHFRLVLQAF